MSRQLDIKVEERETARRDELIKALEFGIVGAFESQGLELLGIAIKFDAYNCLLTVKAHVAGKYQVAFVGSDTVVNCFLKLQSEARSNRLRWRPDKYRSD